MKRIAASALLLATLFLAAGCVVRSIYPWLSQESLVNEPLLLGAWQDPAEQHVAFFTECTNSSDYAYSVLLVQKENEISRFTANLHRIDGTLLLVVGPEERNELSTYASLPGHLLFKTVLDGNSLKLFAIDLETFPERAAKSQLPLLPVSSTNEKPSILTGTTAEAEAFVRAQLADPEFFDEAPLYSFQKLPAAAP